MCKKCVVIMLIYILSSLSTSAKIQDPDLKALANQIAGGKGTSLQRTKRIVNWLNDNFEWTYTDYKQRTVEEIIQRRAGNCAEQARVLQAMLQNADIPSRWVAEINIHPKSERRKASAEQLIGEKGLTYSVFGYMHNDHRWLEVYDDQTELWIPADPTLRILGTNSWIAARMGFGKRPEEAKDMLVPFVVVIRDKGKLVEDRSEYYLIQEFNRYYDEKLKKSPYWKEWVNLIKQISKLGASTFAGELNLHHHTDLMEHLYKVYQAMAAWYRESMELN